MKQRLRRSKTSRCQCPGVIIFPNSRYYYVRQFSTHLLLNITFFHPSSILLISKTSNFHALLAYNSSVLRISSYYESSVSSVLLCSSVVSPLKPQYYLFPSIINSSNPRYLPVFTHLQPTSVTPVSTLYTNNLLQAPTSPPTFLLLPPHPTKASSSYEYPPSRRKSLNRFLYHHFIRSARGSEPDNWNDYALIRNS